VEVGLLECHYPQQQQLIWHPWQPSFISLPIHVPGMADAQLHLQQQLAVGAECCRAECCLQEVAGPPVGRHNVISCCCACA
jgi:hypothetical protein